VRYSAFGVGVNSALQCVTVRLGLGLTACCSSIFVSCLTMVVNTSSKAYSAVGVGFNSGVTMAFGVGVHSALQCVWGWG